MNDIIRFTVPGQPGTQGSKRPVVHKTTGRIVTMESNKLHVFSRNAVMNAAAEAMAGRPPYGRKVALDVTILFVLRRPANMSGPSKRHALPTKRPDSDKLARLVGDGMKDVVYEDDSQITDLVIRKRYAGDLTGFEAPMTVVEVRARQ